MGSGSEHDQSTKLSLSERLEMLHIAEGAIVRAVESGGDQPPRADVEHDRLETLRRGSFVTLHVDDDLRGCIGCLQPRFALADDVHTNAYRAAFFDPRFPAMTATELGGLDVHISVLGPLEPVVVGSEGELIDGLQVGEDGLLLTSRGRRGTFLPSVWEKVGSAEMFVQFLKRKAGIPSDTWPADIECFRYSVDEFDRAELMRSLD